MPFPNRLCQIIEAEEIETVGTAFGGTRPASHNSYSVARVRNAILAAKPFRGSSPVESALRRASSIFSASEFGVLIASLIRFSFLIELTNIKVGSTKMKTRWLPAQILMSQAGSFEPIQGTFRPGDDPRSATFETCLQIFTKSWNVVCDKVTQDTSVIRTLRDLNELRRVPYEFPLSYIDSQRTPVHTASNVCWKVNDDLRWLLRGRRVLRRASGHIGEAIRKIEKSKLEVKVFKTDRSLTGRDKTNRAKRWEVLAVDFQHSSLEGCWSAERRLTTDLVHFRDFPDVLKTRFLREGLVKHQAPATVCPVTFALLSFEELAKSVLNTKLGISAYQIGHLQPLKREGKHIGTNICWQSADGNRIQGALSVEDTHKLLTGIAKRRAEYGHE